jgi:hypothetical protein
LSNITQHTFLSLTPPSQIETTLYHLPRPTKHHLDCLDGLLASLERDYGLDPAELQARKGVAGAVHTLLQVLLAIQGSAVHSAPRRGCRAARSVSTDPL